MGYSNRRRQPLEERLAGVARRQVPEGLYSTGPDACQTELAAVRVPSHLTRSSSLDTIPIGGIERGQMEHDLVERLEAELRDLTRRMPAHSMPPAMLERLEELEDALAEARARVQAGEKSDGDGHDRR